MRRNDSNSPPPPPPTPFAQKYGPWAIVTGAGNGLGAEFARQLSKRGLDLLLIDLDADGLARIANEIMPDGGVRKVRTLTLDLCRADAADAIVNAAQGLEIGLVVNNAGISPIGEFTAHPESAHLRTVDLNVRTPMLLAHRFAPAMRARRRGGLLFVSSLSGLQGTALVANYAATKAWNLVFAESLWHELRGDGVDVLGYLVGTTLTPGMHASQPRWERAKGMPVMEMKDVVAGALDALGRGPSAVAGRRNAAISFVLQRLLPRSRVIRVVSRSMHGMYDREK